ncbi:hypothetical protein CPB85DRAFT_1378115 [Mucidula mucida]|nr:hypothetical protein CPB85DRAFT_1378115 [Mucidula mucida]
MHLPRSVFSQAQLDLFLWLLTTNDVGDVPSVRSMKTLNERLQKLCGIDTTMYEGAHGNVYYVNSLSQIIAQEMANPKVRSHLSFFPEDSGKKDMSDYFLFEPTILNHHRKEYCLPVQWFLSNPRLPPSAWKLTDPAQGNQWHVKANGRRVLSFPIWMYCDYTSGNISKKWNKHNSFLFTPAGLARSETHKEYNIHFLCTSNLAAPLEMLDGIADQIAIAEKAGVEAWDCHFEEEVLTIPWVVALLGNNPMQSEFACHIGLRGKLFCHVCRVMGKTQDRERGHVDGNESDDEEEGNLSNNNLNAPKKQSKFADTARKGSETVATLTAMFNEAAVVGSEICVKGMRTASGTKETYQDFFIQKLFQSHKSKQTQQSKAEALRSCITSLPDCVMSPVWRLQGLDPHQDTPVEILHVVLLGFVKYMWRDILKVQLNKKQSKLDESEHKPSSFDTSGLGLPALNGHTLVKYGLSLTGRDFRTIAQVAPFVLRGLILAESYETWLCLSKLIPMIWQTEISDIDVYLDVLTREICAFLVLAARWSSRWFNKPKFHILVHLPEHICRFGPAILFATEAFELFNAVICGKSVHSNRLAPSRDIALAFAQGNWIRHLLSGGKFRVKLEEAERAQLMSCGPGPLCIVTAPDSTIGTCVNSSHAPMQFARTLTGCAFLTLENYMSQQRHHTMFQTAQTLVLMNGDRVNPLQFIVVRTPPEYYAHLGPAFMARLTEVLRVMDNAPAIGNVGIQSPTSIMVEVMGSRLVSFNYEMPTLQTSGNMMVVVLKDILGSVNAPHDCASNGCGLTRMREVYQERLKTTKTIPCMEHIQNPDDRILNIAQMHNTVHLAPFPVALSLDQEQLFRC